MAKQGEKYFEGVGRRKTSVARVRFFDSAGDFIVNGKKLSEYFVDKKLSAKAETPLKKAEIKKAKVSVRVKGGGINSQAEAVRHGLARALTVFKPELRAVLKLAGLLKRDPRMVERKKYGLKKARKAPQWHKR